MHTIVNRHYLRVAPDCHHNNAIRIDAIPPGTPLQSRDRWYCPVCDANLTHTEYHTDRNEPVHAAA